MAARGTRASRRSPLAHPDTYNGSPDRPHGLAVRTPAFHAGDRRFESGWGYSTEGLKTRLSAALLPEILPGAILVGNGSGQRFLARAPDPKDWFASRKI